MMNIRRAASRTLFLVALAIAAPACSDKFLQVENPTLIDASTVDPTQAAATLASSVQQDYAAWYGWDIMYSAFFTGEVDVSDTFPTRNEFGYRQVESLNGDLTTSLWGPASLVAAEAKLVLGLALPTPTTNIVVAQAALFRGYAILDMATNFCQLTLSGGAPLTQQAGLDTAIVYFTQAITVGQGNGTATGISYANAALVGRARAELQLGQNAVAVTDANAVPTNFVFNMQYFQDLSANETRVVNRMWQFTFDRGSTDVSAAYRLVGDPRVKWELAPAGYNPQNVVPAAGPYAIQQKYPGYASPIRLASGLEASYIAAEASGTTAQLTLINAQRIANGQGAYTGATDAASVLTEFENQRAREFWLEGRRLGDMQRNPAATTFGVPPAGSTYLQPGYPSVGTQVCWILPASETTTNPHFGSTQP